MIRGFPKIFTYPSKETQGLLDGEVEVTEKLDGSAIAFGWADFKLHLALQIRSKNTPLSLTHPDKMFAPGVEYIKTLEPLLQKCPNIIFYGEYLKAPRHNRITYDKLPLNHIALYGVYDFPRSCWYSHPEIMAWAATLGVSIVPKFTGLGGKFTEKDVATLLKSKSYYGDVQVEGIVIKRYSADRKQLLMGKIVHEQYKEVKKGKIAKASKWEDYKNQFNTEARWHKAIQHLRDSGEIQHSSADVGKLIKEIFLDIEKEEKTHIQEWLWNHFGKELLRNSIQGFPEWYKKELMRALLEKSI